MVDMYQVEMFTGHTWKEKSQRDSAETIWLSYSTENQDEGIG